MRDTIDMAREAGCIPVRHPEYDNDVQVFATPDVLKAFEALVRADERSIEREACAKVCDDLYRAWTLTEPEDEIDPPDALDCKLAIRARGNT